MCQTESRLPFAQKAACEIIVSLSLTFLGDSGSGALVLGSQSAISVIPFLLLRSVTHYTTQCPLWQVFVETVIYLTTSPRLGTHYPWMNGYFFFPLLLAR